MSQHAPAPQELHKLVAALVEGRISADDHARLETALTTDAQLRSYYLDYIELHSLLHHTEVSTSALGLPAEAIAASKEESGNRKQEQLRNPSVRGSSSEGGSSNANSQESAASDLHPSSRATHQTTASRLDPRKLGGGSLLLLPSNSGYLAQGRLTARCNTPESKGFTVETPFARVVDLGTEFGVEVEQGGKLQMAVFTGEVDLISGEGTGAVQRIRLAKGESAFVDATDGKLARSKLVDEEQAAAMRKRFVKLRRMAPSAREQIAGLFPTGVDDEGVPLADGAADPHYIFIAGPQQPATHPWAMVQASNQLWDRNDRDSKWIGVKRSGQSDLVSPGTYVYELTFDLPNDADLNSVRITGRWWADNVPARILLNGKETLLAGNPRINGQDGDANRADGTPLSIVAGSSETQFVHGENTLRFSVTNAGEGASAHGVRVAKLDGTYLVID